MKKNYVALDKRTFWTELTPTGTFLKSGILIVMTVRSKN